MIFLNEILEDYRDCNTTEQKQEIVQELMNSLIECDIKFEKKNKEYKYSIDYEKFKEHPDLIKVFEPYQTIQYKICNSFRNRKTLCPIKYLKVSIENMYGFFVDKDVYLGKKYYGMLKTPINEYYKALKLIDKGEGGFIDSNLILEKINNNLRYAEELKAEKLKLKIDINKKQFYKLIEPYIARTIHRYRSIEQYEKEVGWINMVDVPWNEDNVIIAKIAIDLRGYLMNYVRDRKPKEQVLKLCKRCEEQYEPTGSRQQYCLECSKIRRRESWKNSKRNRKFYNDKYM